MKLLEYAAMTPEAERRQLFTDATSIAMRLLPSMNDAVEFQQMRVACMLKLIDEKDDGWYEMRDSSGMVIARYRDRLHPTCPRDHPHRGPCNARDAAGYPIVTDVGTIDPR